MTCDECRTLLDDYFAGGGEAAVRQAIEAHVHTCAECRADLDSARVVASHLAHLPRSLPPEHELWSGIEHRIRPRVVRRPLLVAAAILLFLAPAALLLRSGPAPEAFPPPRAPVGPLVATYETAARELEASLKDLPLPGPAVRPVLERHLATLDTAIAESGEALEADPGNETLQALLLSAHRKKLALLRQAAELATEG